MKKKAEKIQNKEEIAEDWCFSCKDGGLLFVCDYKQCLKAYHADCAGKDQSFFESGNQWTCKWHSCFNCHKSSKFHCFCCPKAVCQRCVAAAEFVRVKGDKGFCSHCLKLALLGEENRDFDSEGEMVDFKDRETYEGLFFEYWVLIKEKEGLTLEHLYSADAQLKKARNCKSGSYLDEPNKDGDNDAISDYEDEDEDDDEDEDEDDIEEHKSVRKGKRSKGQKFVIERKIKSNKREFIGWGSKSLINFLSSIGKNTSEKLSQYDVTSIINGYINENRLFHPEKKRKILCDERLKSVLGRKTVNRNKIYDLLESHFQENLEPSEDELGYSSEDEDDTVLAVFKKQIMSRKCRKSREKKVLVDVPQSCFASITSENIKLVYLKRSLMQELMKHPETFEGKIIGSFVRVKSDPSDCFQRNSHQLVQVTGVKNTPLDGSNTEILLQVSNMSKDICISMLSDDNFSEEECEDLRQKVKDGLLRKLTSVELEQKAKCLHEDITKHWIVRELSVLQNLIDRANEKGRRKELFEYLERRQLLQTTAEQLRLLQKVPRVIPDEAEVELACEDAIKKHKQGDERSTKLFHLQSLKILGDNWGDTGISSVAKEKSIPEVKENHTCETEELPQQSRNILQKEHCENSSAGRKHSDVSIIEELPKQSCAHEDQSNVQPQKVPESQNLKEQNMAVWHCLGPNGERKGPYAVSFLKRWSDISPFASKFKVWKTDQSEENAIPLSRAIRQLSPRK